MGTAGAAGWNGGRFFVLAAPVLVGLAAFVTAAAGPATASRTPADTTLPANPALRSAEARARSNAEAMAQALSQLDGKLPAAGAGHLGVTGPDSAADLRPLREAPPTPSFPANLFVPDPLNPVFKNIKGPFRPNLPGGDHANDPTPSYTEEERKKLVEEGKELFFSTTAWGQRPSEGPHVSGQVLSCASCHSGLGFADNKAHLVGPVRERELALRKTPGLFGLTDTAPFGWDARNPTLQHQARGAIVAPLEMKASREPTKRELDALAEFQKTIVAPPAVPGTDFDPERAKRGEGLFRTPRPVTDPSGEFPAGSKIACATCHAGSAFTDRKPHRTVINFPFIGDPLFDPGQIGPDGNIEGFDTPSLLGARFHAPYFHDALAGDPTLQKNLLGGGFGLSALEGDVGATGSAAARRALLETVLPFYNHVRFNFGFTREELQDLAEFVLSL